MAWLGTLDADRRSTAEAVEEALYRHRQPLFGAVSIAFFDTTSLWFEGAGGESLGQRGHSKDYRGHLKQVVLGIVLDDADRPIASFLMPGNTADVTMLVPVVRRLRERFGIAKACIVADRGMISAATMAALEAEKIEYILGVRERTSREVREEIIDDDELAVPLVIPRQKGATELAVRETTIAGRRYKMAYKPLIIKAVQIQSGRGRGRVTPVPPHRSRRAAFPHRAPVEGRTRSKLRGVDGLCSSDPQAHSFCDMPSPALSPGHAALLTFPSNRPPSLHHLRRRREPALFEASQVLCSRPNSSPLPRRLRLLDFPT